MSAARTRRQPEPAERLTLEYELRDLPTSQHRSGLAGLVLLARRVERRKGSKGLCRVTRLDPGGATLELDRAGLAELFDEVYGAAKGEVAQDKVRKDRNKREVEPLRIDETRDAKTGRTKKLYVYPSVVPRGGFLLDHDPTRDKTDGLWVKLWRDMLWSTLRGVPATRIPYEARAERRPPRDADEAWDMLTSQASKPVPLASTYFVGAMAFNAEGVPFADRRRHLFLLHFWPFAAQVYVPTVFDLEGKHKFVGYALGIPDIVDLEAFCDLLPDVLRERSPKKWGYRPRDAVVDLAPEGGLDLLLQLRKRLARQAASAGLESLVVGIDVVHLDKRGNNITIIGTARIDPDTSMIDEFERVRHAFQDPVFRRQRMVNVLARAPWYQDFGRIFETISYERTIGSARFGADVRNCFSNEEGAVSDETGVKELERLIYDFVRSYVLSRLERKYDLRWEQVKDNDKAKKDYGEKKEKIAKDAFLAIRSRTGNDFVSYFAETLGSVPHRLKPEDFQNLSRSLISEPDRVRTLTLLALSAHS